MGTVRPVSEATTCPGCGLRAPASAWLASGRVNASGACEEICGEVSGFESQHLELFRFHQLTVDAYGAQHPGPPDKPIRLAYSLVGLHLALERGISNTGVRTAHTLMGRPQPDWPPFAPAPPPAAVTVLEVAEAGARAESVHGHAAATTRWAEAVWESWAGQHPEVIALTGRLFTGAEPFWTSIDSYR